MVVYVPVLDGSVFFDLVPRSASVGLACVPVTFPGPVNGIFVTDIVDLGRQRWVPPFSLR